MAQIDARILIVEASKLPKMPQAFQDYVNTYFAEKTILGKKCFYAFRTVGHIGERYGKKGAAPCHSVDLDQFKEGLEGKPLIDWIKAAISHRRMFEISDSWNGGGTGLFDDGD